MRRRLLTAVLICFAVAACVGTEMTSYVDPQYDRSKTYARIVVMGGGMSLDELMLMEDELKKGIQAQGRVGIRSVDLMPPTRDYTKDEMSRLLKESGADGMLSVVLAQKETVTHNVPGVYQPGQTTSRTDAFGNVSTYTTPGYVAPGFSVEKPRATYRAKFIDLATGKSVWIASGQSSGGGDTTHKDLAKSMAAETIAKLVKDGLIAQKAAPAAK